MAFELSGLHAHIVQIAEPPDRSEFMRDAEAALRLPSPMAARRFIASLCYRKAVAEHIRSGAPEAEIPFRIEATKRELWLLCSACGFVSPPVMTIMVVSR